MIRVHFLVPFLGLSMFIAVASPLEACHRRRCCCNNQYASGNGAARTSATGSVAGPVAAGGSSNGGSGQTSVSSPEADIQYQQSVARNSALTESAVMSLLLSDPRIVPDLVDYLSTGLPILGDNKSLNQTKLQNLAKFTRFFRANPHLLDPMKRLLLDQSPAARQGAVGVDSPAPADGPAPAAPRPAADNSTLRATMAQIDEKIGRFQAKGSITDELKSMKNEIIEEIRKSQKDKPTAAVNSVESEGLQALNEISR